ncbi:TR10B factor, partial [Anseranas semipalmata]|nr:TR10B factor [Anseranas semipalmata]
TAAAVQFRRDKLDLFEPSRGGEDFYRVQDSDYICRKCPAEHCEEQNGSSKCLPCKEDEYIEYPNDFPKCLRCRTCREDQVELSPCSATRNRQCTCRNGTFCSPDHPCEMCQKCHSWCPKDQVEIAPCTPHSDLQCGPPTGTFSISDNNIVVIIVIVVAVVIVVVLLIIVLWMCCCRNPAAGVLQLGCFVFLSHQGYLVIQLMRCRRGGLGMRDNVRNEQFYQDQQRELLPVVSRSVAPSAPGLEGMAPRTSYPSAKARRKLVPVPGEDPVVLLRRSFDIFARDVPYKDWKRYGRALDLPENDIALAEMNDKFSCEPFFQMLNMWLNRQGMNASVNTLLETLHRINLGGIAEGISSNLVRQGSFQYEVS